jgi:hypothetical protein
MSRFFHFGENNIFIVDNNNNNNNKNNVYFKFLSYTNVLFKLEMKTQTK